MKKKEIVEELVRMDINTVIEMNNCDNDTEFLAGILRNGCKGYKNYTLAELQQEYSQRMS